MDHLVQRFEQDPAANLLNKHLDESNLRHDRMNAVEKKVCSIHPSEYLSVIECKLGRNMKQRDQSLGCPTGSANKLKEVILDGVRIHNELPTFVINNDQIGNVKASDCLKKQLCAFKLNVENVKKHLALIDVILK